MSTREIDELLELVEMAEECALAELGAEETEAVGCLSAVGA